MRIFCKLSICLIYEVVGLKNVTILKPSGIAEFAKSAALKRIRNSILWLHALCLASSANSTIAQLGC
jgi:hypothetical protein